MLREQLDQANLANQTLSEDIRKVTSDWTRSCKELEQREATWRREEEVSWGSWRGSMAVGSLQRVKPSLERGRESTVVPALLGELALVTHALGQSDRLFLVKSSHCHM